MALRAVRSFAGLLRPAAATGGGCGAAANRGGLYRTTGPDAFASSDRTRAVEAAAAVWGRHLLHGLGRDDGKPITPPFPKIIYPETSRQQREDEFLERLESVLDEKIASKEKQDKPAANVEKLDGKLGRLTEKVQDVEGKLEANQKVFAESMEKVIVKVQELDTRSQLNNQQPAQFNDTHELRSKKVQYDVYKSLGYTAGLGAMYIRLKDHIDPFFDKLFK